jgi:hypothetical protein
MARSISIHGIWICMPLLICNLVLLLIPAHDAEEQDELSVLVPSATDEPIPTGGFLPVDIEALEADLHLLDQQEYVISEWLQEARDEVRRECIRQDIRLLNTLLKRCEKGIDEVLFAVQGYAASGSWPWSRALQQQFNSRVNAILNLKEELLGLDFQCDELEEELEDASIVPAPLPGDRIPVLKHKRRPSSLPDKLV